MLYKKTIAAIHVLNPTRLIMIGSALWNSVSRLCDLEVLDDSYVVYTIRHIKNEHRENWFRDVISFCDENEIPITIGNYLSTPYDGNRFSLVDDDFRCPVSEKIIDMIRIK